MSYDNPNPTSYSPPNSSLSLISVIAGILGLTLFPFAGSVVALITGYMARKEIQESLGTIGGEGLVNAGLLLGWIGVGLTVLGLCLAGAFFGITLCLIPLGIISQSSGWILPGLLALI